MAPDIFQITAANRVSWNYIAPRRVGRAADTFRDGGHVLEPFEVELAGDMAGKRVLQLACSMGDEVLSWSNLGANATGIDISDVAIENARRKAAAAGVEADFRQADMFDLPADLVDIDLIYFSWGAICWVPDLTRFAEIIASRLRVGGAVLAADHHPLWEVVSVRDAATLEVKADYFGRTTPNATDDDAKRPIGAHHDRDVPPATSFVWPVSDVITAFLAAGLRLDAFQEFANPSMYAGLGPAASHVPAYYVVKAVRVPLVDHGVGNR